MTSSSNSGNKLIQQHKEVTKRQQQESKRDLKPFTLYIDFNEANTEFFQKHGVVTSKVLYHDGSDIKSTGQKGYFRFQPRNITTTQAFKKMLTMNTVALPHEEVSYHLHKMVDNFNKLGNSGEFGDLKLVQEYDSHQGFTHYWKFMSDRKHAVQKGDLVQFGMQFRNGIGTLTSLGGDFFSYRLSCLNGSVARDKRFSFSIPHRISASYMLEHLTDSLSQIIQNYKQLLEYYREFTKVKLTQEMILRIIRKAEIPIKYLSPLLFDITIPDEDNELEHTVIKLSKQGKESTLWDFFNSVTDPLTRAIEIDRSTKQVKKIVYSSFVERTSALHRAMFPVIQVQKRGNKNE